MKFMLVIPVDLDVNTSKRSEQRAAAKRNLVNLARDPQKASAYLRELADTDNFLVRAHEATPAKDRTANAAPGAAVTPAIES